MLAQPSSLPSSIQVLNGLKGPLHNHLTEYLT